MSEAESKTRFTYNDIVRLKSQVNANLSPGTRGWIVGLFPESKRRGSFLQEFPSGTVYTVEFEDGSSIEIEEDLLAADE